MTPGAMRIVTEKKVVERIEYGSQLEIEGIQIDGEPWVLEVGNMNDQLWLSFSRGGVPPREDVLGRGEYTLQVRQGKLWIQRHVYRPHHDHDDTEYLLTDPHGRLRWGPGHAGGAAAVIAEIAFGPETVDAE